MENSGDPIKWSVGIITAPRKQGYYLDKTLISLKTGGWNHVVLFAEPHSAIPPTFTGDIVRRRKQYGDWTNWATGLYELFLSDPDSDYYFMLEDDALICKNARQYLEYAIPYLDDFGSISLYTPSTYFKPNFKGFHNEQEGRNTWSTVTVIMSHNAVLRFFSDPDVQKHRFFDIFKVGPRYWGGHGGRGSYGSGYTSIIDTVGNTVKDAVIGKWAEKSELPIFYHTPALAEHIGYHSTLTDDVSNDKNGRMTKDFVGESFDVSQWVGLPVNVNRLKSPPLL
jgi:hypothetical protein